VSIDWNDSIVLSERANNCVKIANEYRTSRKKFADAKVFLDLKVALYYKNGWLNKKASMEKAYCMILERALDTPDEDLVTSFYVDYCQEEHNYKALEKILDAEQSRVSLCQSLIKNQIRQGG
jgi:hypothetical protein